MVCLSSPRERSTRVTGTDSPPDAETRETASALEKMMTPDEFHEPVTSFSPGRLQTIWRVAPVKSIRRSFPLEATAICFPSGDQICSENESSPPSIRWVWKEERGRI